MVLVSSRDYKNGNDVYYCSIKYAIGLRLTGHLILWKLKIVKI